jgi:hypothetical protein
VWPVARCRRGYFLPRPTTPSPSTHPSSVSRSGTRCSARRACEPVRIHDLRHTYASLLLLAGEPMQYVKEQLGHSTIQVPVDLYGHLQPGLNRGAVTGWRKDAAGLSRCATTLQLHLSGRRITMRRACSAGTRKVGGGPGVTRTPGTQFRKLLLYPPELRGHKDLRGRRRPILALCAGPGAERPRRWLAGVIFHLRRRRRAVNPSCHLPQTPHERLRHAEGSEMRKYPSLRGIVSE